MGIEPETIYESGQPTEQVPLTSDEVHAGQKEVGSRFLSVERDGVLEHVDGVTNTAGLVQKSGKISQNNVEVLFGSLGYRVLVALKAVLGMAPDSPVSAGK